MNFLLVVGIPLLGLLYLTAVIKIGLKLDDWLPGSLGGFATYMIFVITVGFLVPAGLFAQFCGC